MRTKLNIVALVFFLLTLVWAGVPFAQEPNNSPIEGSSPHSFVLEKKIKRPNSPAPGARNSRYTLSEQKRRTFILLNQILPQTDLGASYFADDGLGEGLSSYNPLVEDHFEDFHVKAPDDDDYAVEFKFHFSRSQLIGLYESIFSRMKRTHKNDSVIFPSVSFSFELPDS